MTLLKLSISKKMLRFRKRLWKTSKIGTLPVTLVTSNFQELFITKFDSN